MIAHSERKKQTKFDTCWTTDFPFLFALALSVTYSEWIFFLLLFLLTTPRARCHFNDWKKYPNRWMKNTNSRNSSFRFDLFAWLTNLHVNVSISRSNYAGWSIRYWPQLQIWISRKHIALLLTTLFQLQPLQPPQPATWAAPTQSSYSHWLFMNGKMLYASSAKLASSKAVKASRAKGGKQRGCHHSGATGQV